MSDYTPIPYPSCRYHATEPVRVVKDEAEDLALGPGWYDSPAKVGKPPEAKSEATQPATVGEILKWDPPEPRKPSKGGKR